MKKCIMITFLILVLTGINAFGEQLLVPSKAELRAKYRQALLPLPSGIISKGLRESDERQVIMNIQFEKNSSKLKECSFIYLDALGEAIKNEPELKCNKFIVEGHTCDLGSAAYNKKLSYLRAKAVVDYLITKFHFDKNQFEIIPYGESRPLVPNTSETNRMKNRRVVVKNTMQKLANCQCQANMQLANLPVQAWIEKFDYGNGLIEKVNDYVIISDKDGYAVNIVPMKDIYIYVYKINGDEIETLYPNNRYVFMGNPVIRKRLVRIPSFGKWFFLDNASKEELIVILARKTPIANPLMVCKRIINETINQEQIKIASNKVNISRGINSITIPDFKQENSKLNNKDDIKDVNNSNNNELTESSISSDDSGLSVQPSSHDIVVPKDVYVWKLIIRPM